MIENRRVFLLALCVAAGCGSTRAYRPALDARTDPSPETIERDLEECRELALEGAGGKRSEGAKRTLAGAALGAAAGAAIGAVKGDPASYAIAGAGVAGTGSAVSGDRGQADDYRRIYVACLQRRKHSVLNP